VRRTSDSADLSDSGRSTLPARHRFRSPLPFSVWSTEPSGTSTEERRIMAKRSKHSFIKFQKELKRKKKAEEKLAKRQGKKDKTIDADEA
jgi:hypothetical protein